MESEAARDTVKIEVRLKKIQEIWNKFQEIQEGIELLNLNENGDTINVEIANKNTTERAAFEEQYLNLEASAQTKLRAIQSEGVDEGNAQANLQAVGNHVGQARINVKLPVLNLPTFEGQYDQWLLFKDSFKSLIHNNRNLVAIQKFQYLRSSLKGETLQVLNALNASAENNVPISGINQAKTRVHLSTQIRLKSMYNDFSVIMPCLTLPSIIEKLPQVRVQTKLNISNNVQLADPTYGIPGEIELLIGAGLFWSLLCIDSKPTLCKTHLGWIIGGEIVSPAESSERRTCHLITNTQLHDQLERFWRQEDVMETRIYSKQEQICVNFYQDTVRREADGRFIVKLPTKPEIVLGQSKELALKRLHSLERRLKRRPELRQLYNEFMEEYIVRKERTMNPMNTFIPHQPVWRPDSLTTKLRVVFDASAKTSTGTSLNDKLMAGPNLQKDLLGIIIRFRIHKYVMTADIAKMFRQIWVAEEDRKFQLVLWREHPESSLQVLRMNTVTYGTTRAPYLAMRCLKEITSEAAKKLAIKQQEKTSITQIKNLTAKGGKEDLLPATEVLERDFYMDDVLTGTNSLTKAI
ncbi:hypothetical protein ALC57_14645 [Trachymyrmex cornetzi]|uniref:Peptidase aspartic putative domain-containing protein n=1 Tax=Trachymyrmex cornetzi TaxID=471704 RepID=A0A151IY49_9HYME|nr:hypothetical protein ALC57_14645 [Trachymyrmex cornetzi]